jgi:hypothetical protein
MPFAITLIEGLGQSVSAVTAGLAPHVKAHSEKLLRDQWQLTIPYQVDLVIATVSGPCSFTEVAQAMLQASLVVRHGGTIALLTKARPELPGGVEILPSMSGANSPS